MAPRTREQRIAHAKDMLRRGGDAWVATASPSGRPHLVILSAAWDDGPGELVFCTGFDSPTAVNAREARIGLGGTRDVLMLEGTLAVVGPVDDNPATTATFAAATGWDPSGEEGMVLLRFRPRRAMAWREADEITGRTIMRDGAWL